MEKTSSTRARRLRLPIVLLLLTLSSSLLAGCPLPPHRSTPPTPPKPPGVWMPNHRLQPTA